VPLIGQLADERFRALGQRLLYVEAPDLMDEGMRHDYDAAIAHRLMATDAATPWLTFPRAIAEVEALLAPAHGAEAALLSGHHDYLRQRAAWAGSLLMSPLRQ